MDLNNYSQFIAKVTVFFAPIFPKEIIDSIMTPYIFGLRYFGIFDNPSTNFLRGSRSMVCNNNVVHVSLKGIVYSFHIGLKKTSLDKFPIPTKYLLNHNNDAYTLCSDDDGDFLRKIDTDDKDNETNKILNLPDSTYTNGFISMAMCGNSVFINKKHKSEKYDVCKYELVDNIYKFVASYHVFFGKCEHLLNFNDDLMVLTHDSIKLYKEQDLVKYLDIKHNREVLNVCTNKQRIFLLCRKNDSEVFVDAFIMNEQPEKGSINETKMLSSVKICVFEPVQYLMAASDKYLVVTDNDRQLKIFEL